MMLRDSSLDFNGVRMDEDRSGSVNLRQYGKIIGIYLPHNGKDFASRLTAITYVGMNGRTEICATTQLVASGNDKTTEHEYK